MEGLDVWMRALLAARAVIEAARAVIEGARAREYVVDLGFGNFGQPL